MQREKSFKTVALLAREPGILVLKDALLNNPLVDLMAVYTHGLLPKKEGSLPRSELSHYKQVCELAGVPLYVLDYPNAKFLEKYLPVDPFDLLVVLSWRYILSKEVLARPKVAAINFHRGSLPSYKGAEPVKQAINAGDRQIEITAHHITECLDEGSVIATKIMKLNSGFNEVDIDAYIEQVKRDLYPLYSPLVKESLQNVVSSIPQNLAQNLSC